LMTKKIILNLKEIQEHLLYKINLKIH
jgi:hypothetical protein